MTFVQISHILSELNSSINSTPKRRKKAKPEHTFFYPTQSINIILKNDEISPLVTIYKVNGYII